MSLRVPVHQGDHILASGDDFTVTLVEYGDFQCPYCARAHQLLPKILVDVGGRVRFVFRHLPITQLHPHAFAAAVAAEAAGRQGRFWQMHDTLFEHQQPFTDDVLLDLATFVDLDRTRFRDDLGDPALEHRVRTDFVSGIRSGANGTPTFFIDGERWDGPWWERSAFDGALAGAP
jgi:protein-disulfide isomerase